ISKNLDYVLSQFPQSIDTVKTDGIKKTVLLSTSAEARTLNAPAIVEWASIKNEDDLKTFNKGNIPVAVLLEGKFSSLFANRISSATADTLARIYRQPFKPAGDADNKMIVVSDGDIALNPFSQKDGPMTMGMNQYTRYQYANKEFLLNAIEYLVDSTGILESRGKDYVLRLLDKKKVEEDKTFWQMVNTALPVLLIIIMIGIYQYMRKRKYQSASSNA
ncbi:MAG: gliding motility-associated ABC transporter substrate-binding protein GldG, partial [Chitinophagaceae bacterium]|nr:gliding motility-associated ABC transporter substrate-binding protein GldG [Chitinophagaceae bacterium]